MFFCYSRFMTIPKKNRSILLEFKLDKVPALKKRKLPASWYSVQGMIDDKRAKEFYAHIKKIRNEWR